MPRTDTQLTTDATVIQVETIARANTATRVGTMLNDIVSNKINVDKLDIDGTLVSNSDTKVATQKAVKTYVDSSLASIVLKPKLFGSVTVIAVFSTGTLMTVTLASTLLNNSYIVMATIISDGVTPDDTKVMVSVRNKTTTSFDLFFTAVPSSSTTMFHCDWILFQ